MNTLAVPIVTPEIITFDLRRRSTWAAQKVCILNPFSFHILFKVDVANPLISITPVQGVLNSRQKLYLEVTCTSDSGCKNEVNLRFYKFALHHRSRGQGALPSGAQRYLGFRTVTIQVCRNGSFDSESVRSAASSHPHGPATTSTPVRSSRGTSSRASSVTSAARGRDQRAREETGQDEGCGSHWVKLSLSLAAWLLLCGMVLSQADPAWFAGTAGQGVTPQSLAIVCYTLSAVLFAKVVTYRR